MEIRVTALEHATVLTPDGAIDTRSAAEFERRTLAAIEQPGKHLIVDFGKVDLITSAGLRVLVMSGKKLGKTGRKLFLCGLNELVTTVLEVSGLTQALPTTKTVDEALAAVAQAASRPDTGSRPGVGGHLVRLLSLGDPGAGTQGRDQGPVPAATAARLATRLLEVIDSSPDAAHGPR